MYKIRLNCDLIEFNIFGITWECSLSNVENPSSIISKGGAKFPCKYPKDVCIAKLNIAFSAPDRTENI